VVHTAAALPLYKKEEIYSVDVEGTRQVLDAALRAGVDRVVHIATSAVYGIPKRHPIYETDPLGGEEIGDYGKAKMMAEEICRQYRAKGLCVTILRPKSFVGPERLGIFALLYEWAREGRNFPILGKGDNRFQLLDVEDLCQAICLCMTREKDAVNDTFNIGAAEFGTIREDFQAVLDYAGFGKRVVSSRIRQGCFDTCCCFCILRAYEQPNRAAIGDFVRSGPLAVDFGFSWGDLGQTLPWRRLPHPQGKGNLS
jgi:nucleoside-diphosphate-sugar epimerase